MQGSLTNEAFDADAPIIMERRNTASDIQGVCRLATDAVRLTTQLVEAQHSRLDWVSNYFFASQGADKCTNPISRSVYSSILGVTSLVDSILNSIFDGMARHTVLGETETLSQRKNTAMAVLNGVVGDYLVAENNPLAIRMNWKTASGEELDLSNPNALKNQLLLEKQNNNCRYHLLLMVHGSCNSPQDWWQEGHNHGIALAKTLENENNIIAVPLFLHYNTGLHVSDNGQLLAHSIETLVNALSELLPRDKNNNSLLSLSIIAHSMGGLVTRSACHYASGQYQKNWMQYLENLVTLGTPHHGAVLERCGKIVDAVLGAHPYTEPISWLGKIRSNGVTDLGYGNILEQDWKDIPTGSLGDFRRPAPLPKNVRSLAIAAVLGDAGINIARTDGLVTEDSATGKGHASPAMNLDFTECKTYHNLDHVGLLSSEDVCNAVCDFLTTKI